jgi:uncharacterized protein (TIGR00661 family)
MKILYAIQATGNGHLTRAMEIVPVLKKHCETDVLLSGIQADLSLPFDVKYRFQGLSFIFGKAGGINVWQTYLRMNSIRLLKEIRSLNVDQYDMVISDFEPVSAWACHLTKRNCIGLSNQIATLHPLAPKPKSKDLLGKMVLEHYAPTTVNYGLHYKKLDKNIFTPVIRREIRGQAITNEGHFTVYLPSYDDERIIKHLTRFKKCDWQVFSKHCRRKHREKNVRVWPLEHDRFVKSLASCEGILCNAGFGTTSEALFLNKNLLVIPMKMQYEQHCNAAMLKSMGVKVIKSLKKKHYEKITDWIDRKSIIEVHYPDNVHEIVHTLFENHHEQKAVPYVSRHSGYRLFR